MKRSGIELGKAELRYRYRYRDCYLIGEKPLHQPEFDALVRMINKYLKERPSHFENLCRNYPAVVSVFLVHCSLYGYTRRTANFWDGVWEKLEGLRTQNRQALLGTTFRQYIRKSGLAQFDSATRTYVDPILLHTPIPLECLPDFFQDVILARAEDPGLEVSEIDGLLKPIETFLNSGGKVASDFVLRSVDLYAYLKRNESRLRQPDGTLECGIEGLSTQYGLPKLLVEGMVEWFPKRQAAVAVGRRNRVHLRFDPYGLGITMEFPMHDHSTFGSARSITIKGDDFSVDTELVRSGSSGLLGRYPPIVVPAPSERYEVHEPAISTRYASRGVSPLSPTYFNPHTGRLLADGPLPPGEVWVLAPRGWTVQGTGKQDTELVTEELPALTGQWASLQAVSINTEGFVAIAWFDDDGQHVKHYERPVHKHEQAMPRFVGGTRWKPLLTTSTAPVVYLEEAPALWLPIDRNDEMGFDRWTIRGTWMENGEPLFHEALKDLRHLIDTRDPGVVLNLNAPNLLGGRFGSFKLSLQGPLGLDAHLELVVLQGVVITLPRTAESEDPSFQHLSINLHTTQQIAVFVDQATVDRNGSACVVSCNQDVAELQVKFRDHNDFPLAALPVRVQAMEWAHVDHNTKDPTLTWRSGPEKAQPLILPSLDGLANHSLAVRTYFSQGCRHSIVLYADGERVQTVNARWSTSVPQRSRTDLSQFLDTVRAHEGKELELRVMITWNGGQCEYPLHYLEFAWRVEDLSVTLSPGFDGDTYLFSAQWSETCQPATPRHLVLRHQWRSDISVELPITGGAVGFQAEIERMTLPPGHYRVDFVTRAGWRRRERRPFDIQPHVSLDVAREQWPSILSSPKTTRQWLITASAFIDRSWHMLPPAPDEREWDSEDYDELARILLGAGGKQEATIVVNDACKSWSLERKLRLVGAGVGQSDDHTARKRDFRTLSILLRLPRVVIRNDVGKIPSEYAAYWPVLATLTDTTVIPEIDPATLPYLWGRLYALQDPRLSTDSIDPEKLFDPGTPSTLLAQWLSNREQVNSVQWGEIDQAYKELSSALRKLVAVAREHKFKFHARFAHSVDGIVTTFRIEHRAHIPKPPTRLAFVLASIALLQRMAAYNPAMGGFFEKRSQYELLCLVCPKLYDYYLVLAEAALLGSASEPGVTHVS